MDIEKSLQDTDAPKNFGEFGNQKYIYIPDEHGGFGFWIENNHHENVAEGELFDQDAEEVDVDADI